MSVTQRPKDLRSAIDAINRDFTSAFSRKDGAAVAALYTMTAQLLPPGRDLISGSHAIANYWQEAMKIGIRKLETTELEVYGNAAHEVGCYLIAAGDGSEADKGQYLVVWKFEDGAWKMHRDIWNSRRTRA